MTAWTVITELDVDADTLVKARDALREAIVEATGVRPRTKTIRTAAFNAIVHPPEPVQSPEVHRPVWYGASLRQL